MDLDSLTKDWQRLKRQKSRKTGGIEARVLLNLSFVFGEQYTKYSNSALMAEPQEPNKLYLSFNLIGRKVDKLSGRLSAMNPPFKATPSKKDPQAWEKADVADKLLLALDAIVDETSRMRERIFWLLVGGTCFEYVPWVPNAKIELVPQYDEQTGELMFKNQQTGELVPESVMKQIVESGQAPPETFEVAEETGMVGEVGSEILGPLNVFIDQSVRSIEDLACDQWVYIAKIRTIGWVKENFGVEVDADEDLSIVQTSFQQEGTESVGGYWLKDLIPLIQGTASSDDPGMVVVVEAYAPASKENPEGRYCCFIPGQQILHDDTNPYGEIPIVDFHYKPAVASFWTKDYVTDLIPPQRFLNKRLSQLGEQSNATLYSNLLLGGGLHKDQIPADFPGIIEDGLNEAGVPNVRRVDPPQIPQWFLESIDICAKMFNEVAGGSDLTSESKFPGQLRGPMAVPMLQEILDTEFGPLYQHLGKRLGRVKQLRLSRVKRFYPPQRTLHYTDRDQKNEVLTFHKDDTLNSGIDFDITVEQSALLPELRALREARIIERLNGPLAILYMDERTGRLDKSKIASDLQFGDSGREDRESTYRKLSVEIIGMLWIGQPCPPVLPFYDHTVMMDELEAEMATLEFLKASPSIQQAFMQRWDMHQQFAAQVAQQQQAQLQSGMIRSAVAQATQQAAAQAAAEAVNAAHQQIQANATAPTHEIVQQATAQAQPGGQQPKPQIPFNQSRGR